MKSKSKIKIIAVKDEEGNKIFLLRQEHKLPKDFYDKYEFIRIGWTMGSRMAHMVVKKSITQTNSEKCREMLEE